jgi:hypothetical protein
MGIGIIYQGSLQKAGAVPVHRKNKNISKVQKTLVYHLTKFDLSSNLVNYELLREPSESLHQQ